MFPPRPHRGILPHGEGPQDDRQDTDGTRATKS